MQLFARFQQVGVTIVIATHDQNLIQTMPYRRLYLKQGKVIDQSLATPFEGYPDTIMSKTKKGFQEYEKEKG
jgi:ABC-type arginine transport system ATPase subunit